MTTGGDDGAGESTGGSSDDSAGSADSGADDSGAGDDGPGDSGANDESGGAGEETGAADSADAPGCDGGWSLGSVPFVGDSFIEACDANPPQTCLTGTYIVFDDGDCFCLPECSQAGLSEGDACTDDGSVTCTRIENDEDRAWARYHEAMRRLTVPGLLVLLAAGCDDSEPGAGSGTDTDAPTTSGAGDNGSTSGQTETTNATTMTTSPASDDGGTTVPVPECGNATVEPPEECDDGNLDAGDGCEPDCTISVDTQQWSATHGGDAAVQEVGEDVVFDGAGNVYAIGFEVDAVGDANIWVQAYAPDGTPGLEVVLDPSGGGDDRGFGIDVDGEGSLYLAGRVGTEKSASDLWCAKLAADGTELWSRSVTGPETGSDQASAIAVGDDGTVLVGGFIRAGNADNDLWVSAVAGQDGSELWVDIVGGEDGLDDRIGGVGWDPEGNPVAGGYVTSGGFNSDIWVRKYAPDGTETWTTQYESIPASNQLAFDMAIDPAGNVGLAGSTPSTVNDDNVFFIKFDPAGELLQQKTFGSPAIDDDAALALAADSEGAFVVVGYKAVTDTDRDIWMRKWDASGNTVWTQNVSGAGMTADQAAGVAIDANDDIAVIGEIRNEPTSDGDIWIAKYAGS